MAPVETQFATFMRFFGSPANHHLNVARDCGISAGSVFGYVARVVKALRQLRTQAVKWPTGERLEDIKTAFRDMGFSEAIGAIDGSLIRFVNPPAKHGIYYYCRKKFYGVRFTPD